MANVLSAADIVELTIEGDFSGTAVQNKFHYAVISVSGAAQGSQAAFDALNDNLVAALGLINLMRLLSPDNYTMVRQRYQVIAPTRQVAYYFPGAGNGLNLADTLAANVAFALTKRGDLAGRKNISTTHLIGTTDEDYMAGGTLTAAAKALAQAIADFMTTNVSFAVGGVDYVLGPVIYHPDEPLNPTPITSVIVQDTTRVMRRRTLGIGI